MMHRMILLSILAVAAFNVSADSVLYTNATVHTMGPQGTLENANVLV